MSDPTEGSAPRPTSAIGHRARDARGGGGAPTPRALGFALIARAGRRIADAWFAPAPPERLAAVRILVGTFALVYLAVQCLPLLALPELPAESFRPVGIVRVLEAPLDPGPWRALVIATLILATAFTAGVAHRWLAPLYAALLTFVLSYRSSWGMLFHTEDLLVLHVIALSVAPAADAWSVDARRREMSAAGGDPARPRTRTADATRYGWPLRLLGAITCLTYVLAGIAKLRIGGLAWAAGDELRDQIAVDNLHKVLLGSSASPLATPLLEHPRVFIVLAVLTLVIELGAPVALRGHRWAAAWAALAWGFHVGVVALMKIVFPYPLAGVAFAPLLAAEVPLAAAAAAIKRFRARRALGRSAAR